MIAMQCNAMRDADDAEYPFDDIMRALLWLLCVSCAFSKIFEGNSRKPEVNTKGGRNIHMARLGLLLHHSIIVARLDSFQFRFLHAYPTPSASNVDLQFVSTISAPPLFVPVLFFISIRFVSEHCKHTHHH